MENETRVGHLDLVWWRLYKALVITVLPKCHLWNSCWLMSKVAHSPRKASIRNKYPYTKQNLSVDQGDGWFRYVMDGALESMSWEAFLLRKCTISNVVHCRIQPMILQCSLTQWMCLFPKVHALCLRMLQWFMTYVIYNEHWAIT